MTRGRGNPRLKLGPERVVQEVLAGLEADRSEIRVGGVKAFVWLHRLVPGLAERLFRNS